MAKRGYRGKHPHSDMKVSKSPNKGKYSSKLDGEYKKLPNKQKYSYIRSNYYFPQSTCTLTIPAAAVADDGTNIVITSTDGTQVTYVASSSAGLASNRFSSSLDGASLAAAINNAAGHGGQITAVGSSGQVVLTQSEPGPDGNTSVSGSSQMSASGQSGTVSINGSFSF